MVFFDRTAAGEDIRVAESQRRRQDVPVFRQTLDSLARAQLVAALIAIAVCLALCPHVRAQTSDEPEMRTAARELGAQGIKAYLANDFTTAGERLDRAYQLFATPTLGLWSARARVRLGRWVDATDRYRETMQSSTEVGDSATQKQAQRDAAQELAELSPRIPQLTIELNAAAPTDVVVTLDGVIVTSERLGVAQPIDPGSHTLVAERSGERHERSVTLQAAEHATIGFELGAATATVVRVAPEALREPATTAAPAPAPPPSQAAAASIAPRADDGRNIFEPVSIVAMSVGAASLLSSGAAVLVANAALEDCPERNSEHRCKSDGALNTYERARLVSIISFYSGVVLVGAGVAMWFIAGSSDETQPSMRVGAGPGSLWLSGTL
jgi:hypothetical protein